MTWSDIDSGTLDKVGKKLVYEEDDKIYSCDGVKVEISDEDHVLSSGCARGGWLKSETFTCTLIP